jgi:hypothetical protein
MLIRELFREEKVEMCSKDCCGVPVTECTCGPDCKHCDCHSKNKESIKEFATTGSTSAGNIASVANPPHAYGKIKRDKNGVPKAKQALNKDGTAKNGLDITDNVFGGKTVKRKK